jgi:nitrile hydratase subunit beta
VNSTHDVGGMHGFGPVVREEQEPVFHDEWEKGVFAANLALIVQGVMGPVDPYRHAVERMGNGRYLTTSYYEHWLAGMLTLLDEHGIISKEEMHARIDEVRQDPDRFALPPSEGPDELSQLMELAVAHGAPTAREVPRQPRFAVGDAVLTRKKNPHGHTRLPRYARGMRGRIVLYHGAHVLPDTSAHGLGECPEPLYTVRFEAAELWGEDAERRDAVHIDLWESYLSAADGEDK